MNSNTEQSPLWSSVQAYTLATICLVVGVVTGYLLHGPTPTAAQSSLQAVQAQPFGQTGMPQVTPEQLKHMADKQAEPLLAELKNKPNDASTLAKVAGFYLVARQYQTAQEYYERSLAINGTDADVLMHLSGCYYYQGDIDKAISVLQRSLRVQPDHPQSLYILGMIQWQEKGDAKAAIATWERLLKTSPNDPNRAKVEQMISRAKLHLNLPAGAKTDKPAVYPEDPPNNKF
jgi:cytochrome c-type biogenesis protein CcmH/NrfG